MMLVNPIPQILTVSIFSDPLGPIVLCSQGKCVTRKKFKGLIGRKKVQINQSQPTIDITAKLTSLPEKFSIHSAVSLAIVLFSVFPSCTAMTGGIWGKCQLLSFLLLWHVYWILTRRSLNYVAPLRNVEAPRAPLTMIYRGSCQN